MNPNTTSPEYKRWRAMLDTQPISTPTAWLMGIEGLDKPKPQPTREQRIALLGAYEQLIMQRRRHRLKMARRWEIAEMALWALAATVLASETVLLSTLTYMLLIH